MKKLVSMCFLLIGMVMPSFVYADNSACETDNKALSSMTKSLVTFTRLNGSKLEVVVKTADDAFEQSSGFQRVCAETIAAEPILFVFNVERVSQFHMNNVVAPLDIAFIKTGGEIDSIQSMKPYILISLHKPLYSPRHPSIAALETYPGFYQDNNIDIDTIVTWQAL